MDTSGLYDGYGLAVGGGVGGMLLLRLFDYFKNKRQDDAQTNAVIADAAGKTSLIEALEQRIANSEARQNSQDQRIAELEKRITEEITLRLKAQEENHLLRLRITQLEFALKNLGATIPDWNISMKDAGITSDTTG